MPLFRTRHPRPPLPHLRRGVAGVVALMVLTACGFAPLPGDAGSGADTGAAQQSPTVVSGGADAPGTVITAVVGRVCCAAVAAAPPTVVNGISTVYSGWDTAFVLGMAPHYAVAAQEAELATGRTTNAAITALAKRIDEAQASTYLQLSALARAWGQQVPATDPAAASGGGHGLVTDTSYLDVAALTKLKGVAFDRKLLTILELGDKAALAIARTSVAHCANPQAKLLAQQTETTLTAEISQLEQLAGTLA